MVRRSTDGHVRFSSYNDIQRALTAYTTANVQSHLDRFKKNHSDVVIAMIGSQKLLSEVQQISAQALTACYAADVLDTIPEEVDVAEVRTTFLNRIRQFNMQHSAYDKQLATAADVTARRKRLVVPRFVDKLLTAHTEAASRRNGWRFVSTQESAKAYRLFHVVELSDVLCTVPDSDETYTADKVVGVALPEYNKSNQKEVAFFVADSLRSTPQTRSYSAAKRSESLIHELRINSIKVDRA